MRRRHLLAFGAAALALCGPAAPLGAQSNHLLLGAGTPGGWLPTCSASSAFLARTSGLAVSDKTKYDTLICTLVTSGVWAKLDGLWMLAAPDSTTAKLNLVSASFALTVHGTETFAAGQGYTGDGSTGYLDTGLNPTVLGGNYTLNSAAIGTYVNTPRAAGAAYAEIGSNTASCCNASDLWPWYSDGHTYTEVNANNSPVAPVAGEIAGFWIASRTASSGINGYLDGIGFTTFAAASAGLANLNFSIGANHSASGYSGFSADQIAAAVIAGGLSSADVTSLTNAVQNFLGPLNLLYFATKSGAGNITVTKTGDGVTFHDAATPSCSHSTDKVVTPTVLNTGGFLWMVSNISNATGVGDQQLALDLFKIALDGSSCTFVAQIDFSGAIGSGASAAVWSAQWFVDPADNSIHVFAGASPDSSTGAGFVIYEVHPTDLAGFTTWSAPVAIAGTGLPSSMIDPFVMKIGATYYLWYSNAANSPQYVELLSSTALLTGWSVLKSGNWAGWGGSLEAPFVTQIGNNYHILLDNLGLGIYYSDSPVANGLLSGWSAKTAVTAPFTPQHGMMLARPAGYP